MTVQFRHGRNTVFTIADAGDTVRDISTALRDVSLNDSIDVQDTTAFQQDTKSYVIGIKDARFSIGGMFDATIDGYLQGIFGMEAPRPFVYGPEGSATGRIKYSGFGFLTSYNVSSSVAAMVAATGEFQVTGSITRGTFA